MAESSALQRALRSTLGVVAALLLIATLLGFADSAWWVFGLLTHFRVQYAMVGALLLLVGVSARRHGIAVAALLGVLINGVPVLAVVAGSVPSMPGDAATLDVISFNVGVSNPRRSEVIEYLRASDADVIFLHESSVDWEREIRAARLPYRMVPARGRGDRFGSLGLVRRGATAHAVDIGGRVGLEVLATLDGRKVRLLAVHPLSPTSPERVAARDRVLKRASEMAEASSLPVIVSGDLNTSPWSHAFRLLTGRGLRDSERGRWVQGSWPSTVPALLRIPIDHALASSDLVAVDRHLDPATGSDHLALVVRYSWAR